MANPALRSGTVALACALACGTVAPAQRRLARAATRLEGTVRIDAAKVRIGDAQVPSALADEVRRLEGLRVAVSSSLAGTQIIQPGVKRWMAFVAPGLANRRVAEMNSTTVPSDPYPAITATVQEIGRRFEALRLAPNVSVPAAASDLAASLKRAFVEIAQTAPAARPEHKALMHETAGEFAAPFLQPRSEFKSYESAFNRQPAAYRQIAETARGVVAIKTLTRRTGTGFLIAPDWVLTNRHVVQAFQRNDIQVVFDFEEDANGNPVQPFQCDVLNRVVSATPEIDAAALQISCGATNVKDRVLMLKDAEASWGLPMYVIGHPNSTFKTVSDHAFIRYPYRAAPDLYASLKEGVRKAFAEDQSAANAALRDFTAAYVQDSDGFYYYRSPPARWQNPPPAPVPCFGFDSNTAPGSSGSPVFLDGTFSVVGLFFGGMPTSQFDGPYSWYRHEVAMPTSVILKWLRDNGIPH